jgi:hypothetical protein
MSTWAVILFIGVAGSIGGIINAFLANEGLVLSRTEQLQDGRRIWRPGFVGNVFVGAVTAIVLAGLYSPLGSVSLGSGAGGASVNLTIGVLAGALLSGVGGARLLTNEVDKRYEEIVRRNLGTAIQNLAQPTTTDPPDNSK